MPRSPESKDYFYYREMLSGERTLSLPFIACDACPNAIDGVILHFSMKDLLSKNHFKVNRSQDVKAPILYNDQIEYLAMEYIRPQVDNFLSILQRCCDNSEVPQCAIDPYQLASSLGLNYVRGATGNEMALIDFDRKTVTVSDSVQLHYPCARFGMAHETGHFVLHSGVMEKAKKNNQIIHPQEKLWMEHHANHFASCLLMPAPVVYLLFDIFIKRNMLGPVVGQLPAKSCCTRECIIAPIARTLNVSIEAMTLRLVKLGLICEQPPLPLYPPAS